MRTVLTSEKTALLAPMPNAKVNTATIVTPGARASVRAANRRSCQRRSMFRLSAIGCWLLAFGYSKASSSPAKQRYGKTPALKQLTTIDIRLFVIHNLFADGTNRVDAGHSATL